MRVEKVLAVLLVASSLSLTAGGALLYADMLVPPPFVAGGFAVSAVLLVLAYFVWRSSRLATDVSTALAVVSLALSPFIPAHRAALLGFGSDPLISTLDVLQALGFYVFPAIFLAVRIAVHVRAGRAGKGGGPTPTS